MDALSKIYVDGKEIILTESEEMYLETILILSIDNKEVRSVDIANYMNFSKASVSVAMKKLKSYNLLKKDTNSIVLTDEGFDIASSVYEKHNVLASVLNYLGVSKNQAVKDACRMEHIISEESFQIIKDKFYKGLKKKDDN